MAISNSDRDGYLEADQIMRTARSFVDRVAMFPLIHAAQDNGLNALLTGADPRMFEEYIHKWCPYSNPIYIQTWRVGFAAAYAWMRHRYTGLVPIKSKALYD